ncbi:MAG: hypothetical protein JNJ45_08920 [Chthonomonas sp.]|nr:hypothetical protein [Chthonomonas sp.]
MRRPETLYLDSGDCIKAGNLAIPLKPEACWPLLAEAGCDFGTLGNRETHLRGGPMHDKLLGVEHELVVANIRRRDNAPIDLPLSPGVAFEFEGVNVGIFGVMVPMVTSRMAVAPLSEYIWEDPIRTAREMVAKFRSQVDLLIAITHIGISQDRRLAEECPELDAIFGGHSHTVLEQPEMVGSVAIMQGGSHGRFVGSYEWANGTWSGGLIPLPAAKR